MFCFFIYSYFKHSVVHNRITNWNTCGSNCTCTTCGIILYWVHVHWNHPSIHGYVWVDSLVYVIFKRQNLKKYICIIFKVFLKVFLFNGIVINCCFVSFLYYFNFSKFFFENASADFNEIYRSFFAQILKENYTSFFCHYFQSWDISYFMVLLVA